jgi:hypothetical protein
MKKDFEKKCEILSPLFLKSGYIFGVSSLCLECSQKFQQKMEEYKIYEIGTLSFSCENIITVINSKNLDIKNIRKGMLYCKNCVRPNSHLLKDPESSLKNGREFGINCYGPICKGLNKALCSALHTCRGCNCMDFFYRNQRNEFVDPNIIPLCFRCVREISGENKEVHFEKIDQTKIQTNYIEEVLKKEKFVFMNFQFFEWFFEIEDKEGEEIAQEKLLKLYNSNSEIREEAEGWINFTNKSENTKKEIFSSDINHFFNISPKKKKDSPVIDESKKRKKH